jgi:hypothetical protein
LIDTLKLGENPRMAPQILPSKRALFRKVFGSGKKKLICQKLRFVDLGPILCWLFPCDLKNSSQILDPQDTYQV